MILRFIKSRDDDDYIIVKAQGESHQLRVGEELETDADSIQIFQEKHKPSILFGIIECLLNCTTSISNVIPEIETYSVITDIKNIRSDVIEVEMIHDELASIGYGMVTLVNGEADVSFSVNEEVLNGEMNVGFRSIKIVIAALLGFLVLIDILIVLDGNSALYIGTTIGLIALCIGVFRGIRRDFAERRAEAEA